ncbi:hypothetical protein FNV43_RR26663 [Rhamnella rubrinervis]|uniref:non-specific serine/threonine protein kinase n=1 Tax=Rhamnella rubrinervis TaxID=2594499 RepID=A0A8K0DIZ8_9ROSA|nr:hypothetical protein FNV43_RR26663 [Rhamnella rubrinervis]
MLQNDVVLKVIRRPSLATCSHLHRISLTPEDGRPQVCGMVASKARRMGIDGETHKNLTFDQHSGRQWVGRDMSSDTARENASVVDSSLRDMSSDTARENASVVDSSLTEWKQDAQGKETIVAGFYHEGYEEPLLMLMKRGAVHSGLVVKVFGLQIMHMRVKQRYSYLSPPLLPKLKEERTTLDMEDKCSVPEATSPSQVKSRNELVGTNQKVADSISGFEGTTSRKSKLGRDSTNGINTIFEAEQQPHSATKSWKRKRKSLVPGKLTLPQSKLGQDSTTDINTNFGSEQQPQPASKAWKRKRRTLVLKPIWILILANLQSLRRSRNHTVCGAPMENPLTLFSSSRSSSSKFQACQSVPFLSTACHASCFLILGIKWQKMENPDLRTSMGMKPDQKGVRMKRSDPTAPEYHILKPSDVILSFDGVHIANDGTGEKSINTKAMRAKEVRQASWSSELVFIGVCLSAQIKAESPSNAGVNSKCVSSDGNLSNTSSKVSSVSVPQTPRSEGDILQSSNLKRFSFADLKMATRNFRPDSVLGEGGFGSVFKGWLDENSLTAAKPGTGMVIAVKRLNQEGFQGHKEWLAEVNYLGQLYHPHLVKLIGYCLEEEHQLVVYEFMPRGSLENHLFIRGSYFQPFSWNVRLKVALGATKGLALLHSVETKVIYRAICNLKCRDAICN